MTTFSTAGILAEQGKKVAIADIDPQANITSNLGIDETEDGFFGIQELFENPKEDIRKVIRKAPIPQLPSLDIIPGSVLLTATERNINSSAGRENLLKRLS
jgi:chromosome partitioning protein